MPTAWLPVYEGESEVDEDNVQARRPDDADLRLSIWFVYPAGLQS